MSTEAYTNSARKILMGKRVSEFTSKVFRTKPFCSYSLDADDYSEERLTSNHDYIS